MIAVDQLRVFYCLTVFITASQNQASLCVAGSWSYMIHMCTEHPEHAIGISRSGLFQIKTLIWTFQRIGQPSALIFSFDVSHEWRYLGGFSCQKATIVFVLLMDGYLSILVFLWFHVYDWLGMILKGIDIIPLKKEVSCVHGPDKLCVPNALVHYLSSVWPGAWPLRCVQDSCADSVGWSGAQRLKYSDRKLAAPPVLGHYDAW